MKDEGGIEHLHNEINSCPASLVLALLVDAHPDLLGKRRKFPSVEVPEHHHQGVVADIHFLDQLLQLQCHGEWRRRLSASPSELLLKEGAPSGKHALVHPELAGKRAAASVAAGSDDDASVGEEVEVRRLEGRAQVVGEAVKGIDLRRGGGVVQRSPSVNGEVDAAAVVGIGEGGGSREIAVIHTPLLCVDHYIPAEENRSKPRGREVLERRSMYAKVEREDTLPIYNTKSIFGC